ncbi:MAG: hypothetical protein KDK70_26690 [Myxococcales bacterium]|nr:hypothetical protein [Myxococcales bacterium]
MRPVQRVQRSWCGGLLGLLLACTGGTAGDGTPAAKGSADPDPARAGQVEPAVAEAEPEPGPELHLLQSGDKTYYHLELELKADDLVVSGPLMSRDMAFTFSDGGQFEIYLRPETIPVPSPDCSGALILRMPWTNPEVEGAEAAVEAKRTLFSELVELREGRRETQRVVVELNPYIEVAHDDPRSVSLTQCNLFFRHAHATYAYVDHLGPLP